MDAQWLRDNVGDVLAQAMVDLAKNEPSDPIDFLGKRLLYYVSTKDNEKKHAEITAQAAIETKKAEEIAAQERAKVLENQVVENELALRKEALMEETSKPCIVEYKDELHGVESSTSVADDLGRLEKLKITDTMEAIQEVTSASKVYIGRLEPDGSVKFISSTDPEIISQTLTDQQDEEGRSTVLPFEVFQPSSADDDEESEQAEAAETKEPRMVHIKNILRDDRVPFFGRVPMLGSFMAVHVPYKQLVHSNAIPEDGGLIVPEAPEDNQAEDSEEAQNVEIENEGELESKEEPQEPLERPPKVWKANHLDASLVVCLDNMGSTEFKDGFSQIEIDTVRGLCSALGRSLTETEVERYQSEMRHRDELNAMNEEYQTICTEAKTNLAETLESMLAEFDAECQIAADALAASEENAEVQAPEEGDESTEGKEQNLTQGELPKQLSEEEKSLKRARLQLEATKQAFANPWWKTHVRAARKVCIPLPEVEQQALNFIFRVFNVEEKSLQWEELKSIDLDTLEQKIAEFDVTECPSEACCDLDSEKVDLFMEELGTLSVDSLPAWGQALFELCQTSLAAVSASCAHKKYLEDIRRQAEEEELAAKQAAEQAEAEAVQQEEENVEQE